MQAYSTCSFPHVRCSPGWNSETLFPFADWFSPCLKPGWRLVGNWNRNDFKLSLIGGKRWQFGTVRSRLFRSTCCDFIFVFVERQSDTSRMEFWFNHVICRRNGIPMVDVGAFYNLFPTAELRQPRVNLSPCWFGILCHRWKFEKFRIQFLQTDFSNLQVRVGKIPVSLSVFRFRFDIS